MSWNLYEHKVHEKFRELYPEAIIQYNVKLRGLKSKRSRQVDSLVSDEINGIGYRIAIDAKYFTKKIDVKAVESFLGFLNDVGVEKGVLVSQKGFTKRLSQGQKMILPMLS